MSKSIIIVDPTTVDLEPQPIPTDWILSGTPEARSKLLARSHDWTSGILVWECSAGSFNWHYIEDEVCFFVSGEAFMIRENGEEHRFGPGDVGFFPAGTSASWRVGDYVRKVAVVRETMWRPLGLGLKIWNKLLRTVGIRGE